MNLLPRRCTLAIAAVVDIALHARPLPVAAKALAERHNLPPRHLESLLQALVRADILKGVRGPRGGYELARERRRISAGEIVRAVLNGNSEDQQGNLESRLTREVILPVASAASVKMLQELDSIRVEQLCDEASRTGAFKGNAGSPDFTI